ncbi:MAG: VCBS repeat-containing protein, partial [Chitinophagaceae bacterium]|nr:VCBS repeat-containing protein [Chitinophagaceae bacterium]
MTRFWIFIASSTLILSCQQKNSSSFLFQLEKNTGIDFSNDIHNTKDFNIFSYRNFYNGAGVAIGDINNDGKPDIFFTSNMGENKLYLNKGNWKFEDISDKAGLLKQGKWGTGVVMADVNADGWLDIYVCYAGYQQSVSNENELYINNHNGTFTESAKQFGLNESGYSTHAAFFDYDGDGDLDCYILKNSFIPVNTLNYANKRELRAEDWPVAEFLKGGGDKLLRNDNGHFVNASAQAGIYGSLIGFGLGVTVGDVNGDNWPDIYISNDFFERDYLYINQRNGTFKEGLENWVQHTSLASMGADIADVNNDGYPDIFTTDMLPVDDYRLKTTSLFDNIDVYNFKLSQGFYHQFMQNTLQLNNQHGKFMDVARYSGVAASDWSWGGLVFDADNDGLSDLYVCNGIYHDVTNQDFIDFFANDVIQNMVLTGKKEDIETIINKMPSHPIPNKFFKNAGGLVFKDSGEELGFNQPSFSNGAAYGDLDGDGDLDLVINNVNEKAFVYRNYSRERTNNNYIGVRLKGNEQNTFSVGSTIKIYSGNQIFTREVIPSRGFQSSVDYTNIIGLGSRQVDSTIIIWPNRIFTKINKPAINRVHVIKQPDEASFYQSILPASSPLLTPIKSIIFDKHTEDEYVDFYYERGIPMMLSREGPKAACGDVNGDGLTDVFVCGATNQAGQLYFQTNNGFVKGNEAAFNQFTEFEDVAAVFFDCDNDSDLDLLVCSGGNNHAAGSFQFQNRLFKNDGKGNFQFENVLGKGGMNTAVAVADDFDNDGDVDLFIGSRSIPQNYGLSPPSSLLLNDGQGHFTDVSKTNSAIANVGLVTDAVTTDINGDGRKELVVVGEWMTPQVFSFAQNHITEMKIGFENKFGWWQSVSVADIDADGDTDLVLGNIGENFYLRPDEKNPVKMWISDFDNNGTIEKIITRTDNGKDVPVFLKKDLTDQVVSIRKQNLKYEDFARKSIQEIFPNDVLKKSEVKTFNFPPSCIAINNGKGMFALQRLPTYVQFSCVN